MINISVLQKLTDVMKFAKGSVISTGVHCSEIHIVLKGQVGLYSIGQNAVKTMHVKIGSGDIFNETVLISDESLPIAAVALTEVITLPINKNTAVSFIKNEPEMAYELIKELCRLLNKAGRVYDDLFCERSLNQNETVVGTQNDDIEQEAAACLEIEDKEQETLPSSLVDSNTTDRDEVVDTDIELNTDNKNVTDSFSLFPQGHGNYQLPLHVSNILYEKSFTCPLCKKSFKALQVKASKLVVLQTDKDLRVHYKDIEPLYYDVITCPHCLYSAFYDMFDSPDKLKTGLLSELKAMKPDLPMKTGSGIDTFSVFAGYYLALFCAPRCFLKHGMVTAKLLLKLCRVYQDCGDVQMEMDTAKKSLDAYMGLYQRENTDMKQDQQLCIIIAELCFKLSDLKTAKDFFFKAKTNRVGTPIMHNHAERRLFDIREIEAAAK